MYNILCKEFNIFIKNNQIKKLFDIYIYIYYKITILIFIN